MWIDISVAIEYCCVVVTDADTATETSTETVAVLTAENARLREQLKESEQTLQRLRQAYTHVLEQLHYKSRWRDTGLVVRCSPIGLLILEYLP